MHRAVILGTSGAGKSTVARALSDIYRSPHIDLDDLTTGTYPPVIGEAFVRQVREVLAQPDWIIDGDYQRRLGDLVLSRAEVAVWLDLPLRVSLARMWRRTSGTSATANWHCTLDSSDGSPTRFARTYAGASRCGSVLAPTPVSESFISAASNKSMLGSRRNHPASSGDGPHSLSLGDGGYSRTTSGVLVTWQSGRRCLVG